MLWIKMGSIYIMFLISLLLIWSTIFSCGWELVDISFSITCFFISCAHFFMALLPFLKDQCLRDFHLSWAWPFSLYNVFIGVKRDFSDSSVGKEFTCNAGDSSLIPGLERAPGEGIGYPTPVFLGFPCGSAGKESTCNAGDLGSISGLGRSPGEGKG